MNLVIIYLNYEKKQYNIKIDLDISSNRSKETIKGVLERALYVGLDGKGDSYVCPPKDIMLNEIEVIEYKDLFKVGDKLKALPVDKEEFNIDYVIITSINYDNKVYHWKAEFDRFEIRSGYMFKDAELYE